MSDEKKRKLLITIRAALIMAAKAIDEYIKDEQPQIITKVGENVTVAGAD